jgi:hypothetical protein
MAWVCLWLRGLADHEVKDGRAGDLGSGLWGLIENCAGSRIVKNIQGRFTDTDKHFGRRREALQIELEGVDVAARIVFDFIEHGAAAYDEVDAPPRLDDASCGR